MSGSNINILIAVPLLLVLGAATLTDWRERRIPNILSFGAALFGFVLQGTVNGWPGLATAALGWAACLVCFLPFYLRGGMAAGDVKLMAAVGAFIGPLPSLTAGAFTLIAGGLIGLVSVMCAWRAHWLDDADAENSGALRDAMQTRIPYAGAIAAGTSLVLLVPGVVPTALFQFGA